MTPKQLVYQPQEPGDDEGDEDEVEADMGGEGGTA
jgi:hypothetical protein